MGHVTERPPITCLLARALEHLYKAREHADSVPVKSDLQSLIGRTISLINLTYPHAVSPHRQHQLIDTKRTPTARPQ